VLEMGKPLSVQCPTLSVRNIPIAPLGLISRWSPYSFWQNYKQNGGYGKFRNTLHWALWKK